MHGLALAFLVVLAFFFAWRGWAVVAESWEFGARDTSALSIPLVVPQGLWAIGLTVFLALAVVMLLEVVPAPRAARARVPSTVSSARARPPRRRRRRWRQRAGRTRGGRRASGEPAVIAVAFLVILLAVTSVRGRRGGAAGPVGRPRRPCPWCSSCSSARASTWRPRSACSASSPASSSPTGRSISSSGRPSGSRASTSCWWRCRCSS